MKKTLPLLHPVPIVLIGTKKNEKINYATIGDVAIAGLNPPLIMISLHENHLSNQNIQSNKKFSINIPEEDMLEKVDYCGMVSGNNRDKSCLFNSKMTDDCVPYIEVAPISLICEVEKSIKIKKRVIYVSRVKKTIVRDDLFTEGKLSLNEVKSIMYGLDNNYYSVGKTIGKGYEEGKKEGSAK